METDEYKAIINNLRTVIDESGMKQKVVAERAGMPPKQLNNILCFRRLAFDKRLQGYSIS